MISLEGRRFSHAGAANSIAKQSNALVLRDVKCDVAYRLYNVYLFFLGHKTRARKLSMAWRLDGLPTLSTEATAAITPGRKQVAGVAMRKPRRPLKRSFHRPCACVEKQRRVLLFSDPRILEDVAHRLHCGLDAGGHHDPAVSIERGRYRA
jgi:hypothetical protein